MGSGAASPQLLPGSSLASQEPGLVSSPQVSCPGGGCTCNREAGSPASACARSHPRTLCPRKAVRWPCEWAQCQVRGEPGVWGRMLRAEEGPSPCGVGGVSGFLTSQLLHGGPCQPQGTLREDRETSGGGLWVKGRAAWGRQRQQPGRRREAGGRRPVGPRRSGREQQWLGPRAWCFPSH